MMKFLSSLKPKFQSSTGLKKISKVIFFVLIVFNTTAYSQWSLTKNLSEGLNLNCIFAIDPGHIYIACDSASLMISHEAGINWTRQSNLASHQSTNNFYSVFFVDTLKGWIGGTSGAAARTTDGGNNWSQMTMSDQTITIKQIIFADTLHGWAVGNSNKIQHTSDGGLSWSVQKTFLSIQTIYSVFCLPHDTNKVWVAGTSGFIARSIDGGQNWVTIISVSNNDLLSIKFSDINQGWCVGKSGTILLTVNGGANWISIKSPVIVDIKTNLFSSNGSSIIGCNNGEIYSTYNYGRKWSKVPLIFKNKINSLNFQSNFVYLCADGGYFALYIPEEMSAECLQAYNLCLNKCNQDQIECIRICNQLFLTCLDVAGRKIYY